MDNKVVIVKGDKSAFEVKIYQDDELYTLKTNENDFDDIQEVLEPVKQEE